MADENEIRWSPRAHYDAAMQHIKTVGATDAAKVHALLGILAYLIERSNRER